MTKDDLRQRVLIIVAGVEGAFFLAALATAATAAELRELVGAETAEAGEREGERKRALIAQPRLEGVVVELHAAAIPPVAHITPRISQAAFGDLGRAGEAVGEVVADA